MIEIVIYGEPKSMQVNKMFWNKNTDKPVFYSDKNTATMKAVIRLEASKVKPPTPIEGPIYMIINCYYSIPNKYKTKPKMLLLNKTILPTKKPDLDNIIKLIGDSLNKIIYQDDSQIVGIYINKYFHKCPQMVINITNNKQEYFDIIIGRINET